MNKWLDRFALAGLVFGFAMILAPGCLKIGFFATIAFTILHMFTSHRRTG